MPKSLNDGEVENDDLSHIEEYTIRDRKVSAVTLLCAGSHTGKYRNSSLENLY